MRYAKIRLEDISNGPGIRVSLWVQGCNRHCAGCFNPETWDFHGGRIFNNRIKVQFLELAKSNNIVGFSILGGEPLQQGSDMLDLVKSIKEMYPDKTIWMWTGYKYEDLNKEQLEIINYVDVLVDGAFIKSKRTPNRKFAGSGNQRIIDVQQSLKTGSMQLSTLF